MMKIQVLVATMHQRDHSLLNKMNIQTDAIIGNQCDFNSIEHFNWRDHHIAYLNFAERGVGLNRNNALMRADSEICLFADDDMAYVDGYADIVRRAFEENGDADVIIFNVYEERTTRFKIQKRTRVGYLNYLRYGTARIAVRLKSIRMNGIYFNQCFGGGTPHCHGEDNLFLTACLDKKLKIYAVPEYIATLTNERDSTWNNGYDDKYLRDQGILYKMISPRFWKLLCLQDAIRHRSLYGRGIAELYFLMTGHK
ncbi:MULTISPECIES: glycosyltransferase family 2 protein [Megasphaera]|nr:MULTISPECIES: glycosyltransferase family A protein [Megasphaera]